MILSPFDDVIKTTDDKHTFYAVLEGKTAIQGKCLFLLIISLLNIYFGEQQNFSRTIIFSPYGSKFFPFDMYFLITQPN